MNTPTYQAWPDRWGRCTRYSTHNSFQNALQHSYLRRILTKTKRQKIQEIVEKVRDEFEKLLAESHWMDNETKKATISKLKNITLIIGEPPEKFDEYIQAEMVGKSTT